MISLKSLDPAPSRGTTTVGLFMQRLVVRGDQATFGGVKYDILGDNHPSILSMETLQ